METGRVGVVDPSGPGKQNSSLPLSLMVSSEWWCVITCVLVCVPQATQGDVGQAVGLLTSQPPEVQDPGDPQESKSADETWEAEKGTPGTKPFFLGFSEDAAMLSSTSDP